MSKFNHALNWIWTAHADCTAQGLLTNNIINILPAESGWSLVGKSGRSTLDALMVSPEDDEEDVTIVVDNMLTGTPISLSTFADTAKEEVKQTNKI